MEKYICANDSCREQKEACILSIRMSNSLLPDRCPMTDGVYSRVKWERYKPGYRRKKFKSECNSNKIYINYPAGSLKPGEVDNENRG